MKFLHTADWQIGMKAAHVGAKAERVRAARLEAARAAMDLARQEAVDFILVAGDTFEDNAVDRVLVQKVADILTAADRPVYILPGNHDPLAPGSVWTHAAWRQPNLQVLTAVEPLPVAGGTLYAVPLCEKHSTYDPTRRIDATADAGVAIGLAHGSVEGCSEDLDFPIRREAAVAAGLDYLALGHWHSTAFYPDAAGAVRMAYSGTPETTKFGERDSGNVLVVEIGGKGQPPKVAAHRTGRLRWTIVEERIDMAGQIAELAKRIEAMTAADATLLDVRLGGLLYPADEPALRRIEEIAAARFLFHQTASALRPSPDGNEWLAALPPGPVAEAAKELCRWADPAAADRPPEVTAEVAARALVDLYSRAQEAAS